MRQSEATKLLGRISGLYNGRVRFDVETSRSWAQMFREFTAAEVEEATDAWLNKSGEGNFSAHPPSAPEILQELKRVKARTRKRDYVKAPSNAFAEHGRRYGLVEARMRASDGKLFKRWEFAKDCVQFQDRYYRRIDFIAKWAPEFLAEECRRVFPGGSISKVYELFEGAKDGEPRALKAVKRWEEVKNFMLEIAIENAFKTTGKLVTTVEEHERTERMPYSENESEVPAVHRERNEQP